MQIHVQGKKVLLARKRVGEGNRDGAERGITGTTGFLMDLSSDLITGEGTAKKK